jgi:Flp pilus assembly protein TadD
LEVQPQVVDSDALLEKARGLEKAGKPRQALELLEQAVTIAPNAPEVLSRLSFGYLNRGDNQRAADYAARAVAVDPTSSEGWIVLGAARDALGDPKGARDAYRSCVDVGKGEYLTECRRVAR